MADYPMLHHPYNEKAKKYYSIQDVESTAKDAGHPLAENKELTKPDLITEDTSLT